MKYLVTGGAGFIGNAVTLQLLADGHEVVIVDNCNDYYEVALKEARLKRLPDSVIVVRADIHDKTALESLFETHTFDGVCHLAAQAGVRYSLESPETYIESNYVGTFALLEVMRAHDVKRFVFASSSSVYGEEATVPFTESMSADRAVSVYAATKRAGEILAYTYHHLYQFDVSCLRFFTVYGPWGRPDMAPFLFTDRITQGQSIQVFNEGKMLRDFTYIDDIVDGVVAALERVSGYEIYNLGNGSPVQLLDFIKTIETTVGKAAQLEMASMQAGDVTQTYADIEKATMKLDYRPKTTLAEGIKAYIDWYNEYYQVK